MDILNEKITGIEISISGQSKRIINLQIKKEALDKLPRLNTSLLQDLPLLKV